VISTFTITGTLECVAAGINNAGTITGFCSTTKEILEGFSRTSAGVVTTFEAPGAGTKPGDGTETYGINTSGMIVGPYITAGDVYEGYVRTP
jgi:hypothetical protein